MSDVLKPSRKTPPPEIAALSPPLSPKSEKAQLGEKGEVPADLNIPDNYVQYTLKHTKPKPPITWNNWWKELNYISVAALTITPSIALWGVISGVPLRWETAAFAVLYYFITGLGITAGRFIFLQCSVLCHAKTVIIAVNRLPSSLGSPFLQCI